MKILLLQSQVHLPSLGGGNKANRRLLEQLAQRGHTCRLVGPALTTRAGPTTLSEFQDVMSRYGIELEHEGSDFVSYVHAGVEVDAMTTKNPETRRAHMIGAIRSFAPDWIIVADDRERRLLEAACAVNPDRVVLALQTIVQLPFGPLAWHQSEEQCELIRRARAIIVISNYMRDYIREYSGLEAHLIPFPVFGDPPFSELGRFDRGTVTMINPCVEKGVELFLELAREFPATPFAAVPTWGADEAVLRSLADAPNVEIVRPSDEIENVLAGTRVLVAPSLWPETFGYVVVEAMLRGIPVLAADQGGLREAKLGVEYLLPVKPAVRRGGRYTSPEQDVAPWSSALRELLSNRESYERCSLRSRDVARRYVSTIRVSDFEELLWDCDRQAAPHPA